MSIKAKIEQAARIAENRRLEELRQATAAEKSAKTMYDELLELAGTGGRYATEHAGKSIVLNRADGAKGTLDFSDADKVSTVFTYPGVGAFVAPVNCTVDEAEKSVAKFITEKHEGD